MTEVRIVDTRSEEVGQTPIQEALKVNKGKFVNLKPFLIVTCHSMLASDWLLCPSLTV